MWSPGQLSNKKRKKKFPKRENCSEHINIELRMVCRICTTIFCEDCPMDSVCTKVEGKVRYVSEKAMLSMRQGAVYLYIMH